MSFARTPLSFAIFSILSTSVLAESTIETSEKNEKTAITLNTISLKAEKDDNEVGKTVYTKEQLQAIPNIKKSISDFLKVNPNVQFGRNSESASNQASLAPEEISINGAPSFSNKFVIDGVNTSNTFDPVGKADTDFYSFSNNTQTANINTDLLCELEVIDSNASAEHGQFQGGVISAKTCAPKTEIGKIHGTIIYDYTTSAWSKFNYASEKEQQEYETDQGTDHPKEYTIQGFSTSLYSKLNQEWGINTFAGRRASTIPVLSGFSDFNKIDTKEKNDNIGATLYFNPNDKQSYQFGIQHYNYNKDGYTKNTINSDYNVASITDTLFLNTENIYGNFKLNQSINYRTSTSERKLKENSLTSWLYSEDSKNWRDVGNGGVLPDGGYGGNLINKQSTLSYDIKSTFTPIKIASTEHNLKVGLGYIHTEGSWNRPTDMYMYLTRNNLENASCSTGDTKCDEADLTSNNKPSQQWTGQFFNSANYYGAAKHTARQDQWSVFFEDDIKWENLKTRLGIRSDYDSLSKNFNVAPRITVTYTPLSDENFYITTGFNRYYGTTFLSTELDEKSYMTSGKITRSASYNESWNADNNYGWKKELNTTNLSAVKATQLNTPFSDEIMLAINGQFSNINWGLKWVNREFKDQIEQKTIYKENTNTIDYRTFNNIDNGKADTFTVTINNIRPIYFLTSENLLGLNLSYINNKTRQYSYKTAPSSDRNLLIDYNGRIIDKSMLPTKDAPLTARINWNIKFDKLPFQLDNFFYYRSGSTNYTKTNKRSPIDAKLYIYEEKDFSSRFTWDTRASYIAKISKNQNLIFGLTITNLLNKYNETVDSNSVITSEEGRRFVADITFKF